MINLIFPKIVLAMDDGICNPTYLKDISMERWEITAVFECWRPPPPVYNTWISTGQLNESSVGQIAKHSFIWTMQSNNNVD